MNDNQKYVLGIGTGLVVILLLFVPWVYRAGYPEQANAGYRAIFLDPPKLYEGSYYGTKVHLASINYFQQRVTIAAVVLCTVVAFFLFRENDRAVQGILIDPSEVPAEPISSAPSRGAPARP